MYDVPFVPCCCRGEWIFGYPAESLVGQAAHVLRHPGDQLSIQELVQTKDYSESWSDIYIDTQLYVVDTCIKSSPASPIASCT